MDQVQKNCNTEYTTGTSIQRVLGSFPVIAVHLKRRRRRNTYQYHDNQYADDGSTANLQNMHIKYISENGICPTYMPFS
jgi:hypothetical protein